MCRNLKRFSNREPPAVKRPSHYDALDALLFERQKFADIVEGGHATRSNHGNFDCAGDFECLFDVHSLLREAG